MTQRRSRLRLALEARDHAFARQEVGQHGLDRNFAIERDVEAEIHGRHTAATQLAVNVVVAERRFAQQRAEGIGCRIRLNCDRAAERWLLVDHTPEMSFPQLAQYFEP